MLTLKAEQPTQDEQLEFEELMEQEQQAKRQVVLVETIAPLVQTNVTIGSEVGNTCPVCRQGTVEELGGCNTCTSCGAQLKCGL